MMRRSSVIANEVKQSMNSEDMDRHVAALLAMTVWSAPWP
jgi:hypothetical protein